ncbi:hypothetical protein YB2330_006652 [Saitoella coloradoensis]
MAAAPRHGDLITFDDDDNAEGEVVDEKAAGAAGVHGDHIDPTSPKVAVAEATLAHMSIETSTETPFPHMSAMKPTIKLERLAPSPCPVGTPNEGEDSSATQEITNMLDSLDTLDITGSKGKTHKEHGELAMEPPAPDARKPTPEPEVGFDFGRFLEMLRHRSADPVARYMKSFLSEFSKKQWHVEEQVRIIQEFLDFIHEKMSAPGTPWANVSDAEFVNAREGMEKLVMNRLYALTFSPLVIEKRKKEQGRERGVRETGHEEDVERDEQLEMKMRMYAWVREENLDIPCTPMNETFLKLAGEELCKINSYRAPRDKLICILNCSKVIFGLLRHASITESADSFLPFLILVILRSRPAHLISNLMFVQRFRGEGGLGGEGGYYLSSLGGAVGFLEGIGRGDLTVSDEEFERNVEGAIRAIAEEDAHLAAIASPSEPSTPPPVTTPPTEEPEAEIEAPVVVTTPRPLLAPTREILSKSSNAIKTISKPLSGIGSRFWSTAAAVSESVRGAAQVTDDEGEEKEDKARGGTGLDEGDGGDRPPSPARRATLATQVTPFTALPPDLTAESASMETYEAERRAREEHAETVETLAQMFPGVEREVVEAVVIEKAGRVGSCVDVLLEMGG